MQAMAHWMLATWAMVEPRAVVVMIAPVVMVWLAGVLDAVMVIVVDRWGHLVLLKDLKGAPWWYAVLPQRGVSQGYLDRKAGVCCLGSD